MFELLEPQFLVSTATGAVSTWGVARVYLNFILRDIAKLDERVTHLERTARAAGAANAV